MALWVLGMIYALILVWANFLVVHPSLYTFGWSIVTIFILETSAGLQHWLIALEYYTSAIIINEKLNHRQN